MTRLSSRAVAMVSALGLTTGACVYGYGAPTVTTTRQPGTGPIQPRHDALPGSGALAPDGTFRFTVALDRLCQRERFTEKVTTRSWHKGFNALGFTTGAAALGLGGFGVWLAQTDQQETDRIVNVFGGLAAVVGVAGLACVGVFRYVGDAGGPSSRTTRTRGPASREGTDELRCERGAAVLGSLSVQTPWGQAQARPDDAGVAAFAIDWGAGDLAPRGEAVQALLHQPWTVTAPALGLAATWQPTDADVALALTRITHANDDVITTAQPAELDATLGVPDVLTIGDVSALTVTISNRGGSSALGVTATTRSTLKALNGLPFDFGMIQPGRTATRTVNVRLPTSTPDDAATVQLRFTEAHGRTPPEVSQKLQLSRSFCAGGKLTRAAYDEKRARLQKTRGDGLITQDELDRYDADLLRCLE